MKSGFYCIGLVLMFALDTPMASANDSSSSLALGGITLTRNNDISMDSEDLFLSQELVRVRYSFTNRTVRDITTMIAFPLPDLPGGDGAYFGDAGAPDWKALDFKTKIDGVSINLDYQQTAHINGRIINDRLAALGWPLNWWEDGLFMEKIARLRPSQKQVLVEEGLLNVSRESHLPLWSVTTNITRQQTFPAGKTVIVEHSYKPVTGGSVAGNLHRAARVRDAKQFRDYAKNYCIDKSFIAGFDLKMAEQRKSGGQDGMYAEHWLGYVLKSGANWKGPIKNFRLVVDKGAPENLLSFCMDGVKKISPTQFEVRKKNFEPTKDLDILITTFFKGD